MDEESLKKRQKSDITTKHQEVSMHNLESVEHKD